VPSEFAALGVGLRTSLAPRRLRRAWSPSNISREFNGYRAGWRRGNRTSTRCNVYFTECMKILDARRSPGRLRRSNRQFKLPEVHPLFRGTVDFGYLVENAGRFLRDYKNGEGIGVEAPNNRQLLYYAALHDYE
jgi:hypothetical protein